MASRGATNGRRLHDDAVDTAGYTREQQVLHELKRVLGWVASGAADGTTDAYLLRCLGAVHYSVAEAVAMLKQRRVFEESLPSLRITAPMLEALRSGAVSIIGCDVLGRPVLYLSMQHFVQSAIDTQEMQRLVTLVMEYMLAYCVQTSATAPSHGPRSGSAAPLPSPLPSPQQQQQQFIVLVNEESSSWHANQSVLTSMSTIFTVVKKYYPRLIGLVLLFEASWDVRQGIKETFAGESAEARRVVQMVSRADIQKYIDRAVLPREVGGHNATFEASTNFADDVLRHWYLKTSYLLLEEAKERPLWQLPPSIATASEWTALRRRNVATASCGNSARVSPPLLPMLPSGRSSSVMESASLGSSRRSHIFRGGSEEDDGLCSILSDPEEMGRTVSSCKYTPKELQLEMDSHSDGSAVALALELRKERELRANAEQQLKKMRLGITLDLATATGIERALACMRAELNVLVANIIVRARQATANGSPPTLLQLLELTLSAVETAAHKVERVPAMKYAVPVRQSEARNSLCCCFM
ncbi:hypothetical protein DQ04_00451100 [Trypanosoma grayi]|uniref:hypothetical protein n=1 Tax=Trypanosoma grayi TaxID=71804 RepID=UPI0004F43756|nr:hypothetical protein DQ04_00451100 [Trypanosoma grayi]KEG14471.1 hypothetical protein DQ04_00451100 [Trypanosoma grayi]